MYDKDVLFVRNSMAEKGYELTPELTKYSLEQIEIVRNSIKENLEFNKKICAYSLEERKQLRMRLAESGQEVCMKELDEALLIIKNLIEKI